MKRKSLTRTTSLLLGSLILLSAVSCTPYQQQGAAVGGLAGAGLGAIVGDDGGDILTGAALGAAAGTGVTAYQENQQAQANQSYNNTRTYNQAPNYNQQQNYTPPAERPTYQTPPIKTPVIQSQTSSGTIPSAIPSQQANTVISPYPPYNVLDTGGAASGTKLCDPSTIPIDPATGKSYIDPNTGLPDVKRGKYFLVP